MDSSSSSSSLPHQITTLLNSYVEEKEAELLAIKVERDEEREKNDKLTLGIQALQKRNDELVKEYSLGMATIETHLDKLVKENEMIRKEREEMEGKLRGLEGKVKRLEEDFRKEKRMKEQVIDEYRESYMMRNSIMMQLVIERVDQVNSTVGGGDQYRKIRRTVEMIELEDEN